MTRKVGDGDDRRTFPSFDNLAVWAVENGHAQSVEAVRTSDRRLWGDLLFLWYTKAQIACVFAVSLAKSPEKANWISAVIEGPWDADIVTGVVDGAAGSGVEAIQLLFPGQGSAAEAIDIVKKLAAHERWSCVDIGWLPGEQGESVQVGLRWIAPDKTYESWALGIACFEPMPFTRCFQGAPFIAVVLRPTPPVTDRAEPKFGLTGMEASHLAHMDDGLGEDKGTREKWFAATKKAKAALIHPDPLSRARAKVTFAFHAEARAELEDVFEKIP